MSHRAVVIAHPETLAAEAIAAAIARYPALIPFAIATSGAEVERLAERADVVAMHARVPGADRAAARLRRLGVRVVMLGGLARDEDDVVRVRSEASIAELAEALAPGVTEPRSHLSGLTSRERQILSLVARGLAGKQVARELGISPKTVEQHKTRIFQKLKVTNQAAAAAVLSAQGGLAWSPSTT